MKIMMIPGERNEELILKVREATEVLRNDEGCEDSEYNLPSIHYNFASNRYTALHLHFNTLFGFIFTQ